ncbi:MAG: hypothetical protein CMH79_05075 [Nitrospinae bacterium]|nr:hypothetical protein [Nitrospinota bacterium]|tara:strand:- start:22 stop:330 length:309 start_codon:yes stop_codon:yes gene_type:complete
MGEQLTTIIITALTVLGSSEAWKFFKTRLQLKSKEKNKQFDTDQAYNKDLKERVQQMEGMLLQCVQAKDDMQQMVLDLTSEVSTLRERVVHLEKENERLKNI